MDPTDHPVPSHGLHTPAPPSKRGPTPADRRRRELRHFLLGSHVPQKEEFLRVKSLVRSLSGEDIAPAERITDAEGFLSAYLDLYLGRLTGDLRIERESRRQCLRCLDRRLDGTPTLP